MTNKKSKGKKDNELNNAMIIFCEKYIVSGDAGLSYREAHPNASRETSYVEGSRYLRKPKIRAYLEERYASIRMSANQVFAKLTAQAEASLHHFIAVTEDGAVYFDFSHPEAKEHIHLIKSIKNKRKILNEGTPKEPEMWMHEWTEVTLVDSQAALKLLGQSHKLFSDRLEVVHTLDVQGLDNALDKIYSGKKK